MYYPPKSHIERYGIMRKSFVHIFMLLTLVSLLAGCAAQSADSAAAPSEAVRQTLPAQTTAATEEPAAEATLPPEEVPATEEAPETAATEPARCQTPYLLKIEHPDQSIFGGPGYDHGYVDTVRKAGTYTIVEETVDPENRLWGKLKSGIGWVDLTQIQSEAYKNALISANYADRDLVQSGAYHHYSSGQEYSIPIAFRAYGKLRDVRLFGFEFRPDGYFPAEDIYTLPELTGELPLVADLAFPGDMTMYGIAFIDEAGVSHVYSIHISGRNGALVLTEE